MTDNKLQTVTQEVTPMTLIESAQQKGASIEQMSQLLDLNMRWEVNEARKSYNNAMAAFKKEQIVIEKDSTVDFTFNQKRTYYKHTSLNHVVSTVVPVLAKYGLAHSWQTDQEGAQISVSCRVYHEQGHSESIKLSAAADQGAGKNGIQAIGSTITYLQRYTLMSILGLSSGEHDDDGAGAEPVTYISKSEQADLQALMDEVKISEERLLKRMQIPSLDKLPADKCQLAIKLLEGKRESQ